MLGRVSEVVRVHAARQRRRRLRLHGHDSIGAALAEVQAQERERQPREVRPAAGAADDDVGLLAGHRHLLERFLADHRLMQQDVVEDGAQRVLGVVARRGILDGLADGDPQRAGAVGRLGQDGATVVRGRRGAGHDRRAVGLHQDPPVRLLVVARADHVDLDLEAEERAGESQRTTPLAGAGLCRQATDAGLLVVERLGHAPCSACDFRPG